MEDFLNIHTKAKKVGMEENTYRSMDGPWPPWLKVSLYGCSEAACPAGPVLPCSPGAGSHCGCNVPIACASAWPMRERR